MDREQARQFIRENPEKYLQPDKSGKGYICPICGSGSGKNGTGITTQDGTQFTCWAGCFKSSDIIDIIGQVYSLESYPEKLSKAAEIYGLEIETNKEGTKGEQRKKPENSTGFAAFFAEAQKNLSKTDYHIKRGISQATAEYFKLGYVEKWRHPKAPKAPATPRLIIPTGKDSYTARLTEPGEKGERVKKVGEPKIFNAEALRTATAPIFITEGELDAISIYEAGGIAVALGGVNQVKAFAEIAKTSPKTQPYIIALDNDAVGKKAGTDLYNLLKAQERRVSKLNIYGTHKDANEALQANREAFTKKIAQAVDIVLTSPDAATQWQYEQDSQASAYIDTMRAELSRELNTPALSTGFKNIDGLINGGLYPGLYFIGAISSLGKTTLALQIADNVAKQGNDALIISLEMAKRELIAKSISRETAEYSIQADGRTKALARTTADIMIAKRQQGYYNEAGAWQEYSEQKKAEIAATVNKAFERYSEYAPHIFIYEGIGNITTEAIKGRIEEHRNIYGRAPVLIIDYLQILQAESDRVSDKQKVDKAVVELKRISRDCNTPVIAVSSVNRASYDEPISMESFKESGGIEFSSDILIGLQYKGMDYAETNGKRETEPQRLHRIAELNKEMREAAKEGNPQPIEVKILKNRNGNRGTVELNFYPMYNLYQEKEREPERKPRRV